MLAVSDLIDEIEARVVERIPQARHIDLEVNHTEEKAAAAAAARSA